MAKVAAELGSTANRYQILAKLAVGGMAEIFLVRGASVAGVERYCVLKRILRERAANAQFAQMFVDEARLAAQLQHPNIAAVYDIGMLGDSYFFTMEYVHGETVRSLLQRAQTVHRPVPLACALTIIAGAAAGLHHAHERNATDGLPLGIVHRDVSPSSLMVSYEGNVKVVDFGVAMVANRSAETLTGAVNGKIGYLSPEQCRGARVDRRSDLFSLGIVMWELLTGARLYQRESDFESMTAIMHEPPSRPSLRRAELPHEVDDIVLRLLAKSVNDRFQSAAELVEVIESASMRAGAIPSTSAVARLMRDLFGVRAEPWLEIEAEASQRDAAELVWRPIPSDGARTRELPPDNPVLRLFHLLRRRGFLLGPDDLLAFHRVLAEGYGLASRAALRDVCCALWAKSRDEQQILDSLFDQLVKENWRIDSGAASPPVTTQAGRLRSEPSPVAEPIAVDKTSDEAEAFEPDVVDSPGRLPPVRVAERLLSTRPFVLVPQHPIAFRAVAQAWRRLRRPVRNGPSTELDVRATVARRVQTGVATPPVLRARRRNTARVLLLVDRDGSMSPFNDFVTEAARAILQAAQLAESTCFYFHDVPAEHTNDLAVANLPGDSLFPAVDAVIPQIAATREGWFYRDPELLQPVALADVLRGHGRSRAVVVITDAGAARGRYDAARVIDSLAFARAVREVGSTSVWMNPLPPGHWRSSSAAEIARHVPMFPLSREGTYRAVNHLRGQQVPVEQPL